MYLFDVAALKDDTAKTYILSLDRIELDETPTITLSLNDTVRKSEKALLKECSGFRFVSKVKGKGTKQEFEQEMIPKTEREMYLFGILDMTYSEGKVKKPVVSSSTHLLDGHDNELLKVACQRNPEFSDYLADEIADLFKGDVKLREEEEAEDEKN